jgi:hypothetical protein
VSPEDDRVRPVFAPALHEASSDHLTGTLTLHDAHWKSDALANQVDISEATLHLGADDLQWDPVEFSYGPLKGTASLDVPSACSAGEECPARLDLQFQQLNAEAFQAALLGAHKQGTLLASLLARFRPSSAPVWPRLDSTVKVGAFDLGPVTLHDADITLRVLPTKAEITSMDASLLGGRMHASGELDNDDKPVYTLQADFEKLKSEALCQLLGLRCTGGVFDGSSKVELSGFTSKALTASAKGTGQFDWKHAGLRGHSALPSALARFDDWTGEVEISDGALKLGKNQVRTGGRKTPVQAEIKLINPPRLIFAGPPDAPSAKR